MSARHDAIVFHGTVEASAFLIDPSLCGEEEARRRIIAMWEPGVSVSRVDGGYLVRLPRKETIAASRAPGLPLVARGGGLIAFEFPESVEQGTLVRKTHGRTIVTSSEEAVDPARWIDLRGIATAAPPTLGKPPAPPRRVVEPEEREVRAIIPGAPPLSSGAIAAIKALMKAQSGEPKPAKSGTADSASLLGCLPRLAFAAFLLVLLRLTSSGIDPSTLLLLLAILAAVVIIVLLLRRQVAFAGGSSRSSAKPYLPAAPTAQRKPSRLRRWLTSLAITTRLAGFIGRAHAKYLAKMLELFDEGNLEEALKHAIPLGGEGSEAGLAFAAPKPRASLALNPWRSGAAYTIPFHENVYNELQRRYRDAFERLDRAGRVEEAAFVLAELLNASAEAVSYLEKKGRFRTAAEVAEARGLPAEVVVRQWLLAGEPGRAVAIARLRNAFAVAVAGLEKTHPETAKLLRVHWAEWLASSGNYVSAVDVIWPVEESRALARSWIDRGIAQGGTPGARLMVRRLSLIPEEAEDTAKRILAFLDDEEPELAATRAALGRALVDERSSPHVRLASRVAARAIMRDGLNSLARQLASHGGEMALRRDIPDAGDPQPWQWAPTPPQEIVFDANDTGATIVHDVALLHEGRVVVAQGESGLSIIGRDGKQIARLDQPAYRIVLSDAADRAIVVAPRGVVMRLARADFAARTAAFWCDARLHAWSSTYDGGIWFAAEGKEILAIDATSSRLESLWHNPEFPAPIVAVRRQESRLHILGAGEKVEHWTYELPSLTLRERESVDTAPRFGQWHIETSADDREARVVVRDTAVRVTIILRGAREVRTRLQHGTLAIGDDRGRAIIFDLVHGVVRRDLRV